MIIGKIGFAKAISYYGLELCLAKSGYSSYNIDEKTASACDIIFVSLFWFRDILNFELFLRRSGLKNRKKKPIIIAGGLQATVTPEIIAEMADYVFIGDGDIYFKEIIEDIKSGFHPKCEYLYYKNKSKIPKPAVCKPSAFVFKHQGLNTSGGHARKKKDKIRQNRDKICSTVYRLEIARGCKFKCPFCLLSGLKPYQEVPENEILKAIKKIPGKSMSALFAPERACHSNWSKIQEALENQNLRDNGSDVRLENLQMIEKDNAIFGLEGVSYRLRKLAKKPFTNDFIIEKIKKFITTGKRIRFGGSLTAYFIADLPSETLKDYDGVYELLSKISKEDWSRQLCLKPVLNPLSPKPFTVFKNEITHPFRNYPELWYNILRGGDGKSRWDVKIKEYSVWNCFERIIDTIIHNGKAKGYSIIQQFPDKLLKSFPSDWTKSKAFSLQVLEECKKIGLTDEILKISTNSEF